MASERYPQLQPCTHFVDPSQYPIRSSQLPIYCSRFPRGSLSLPGPVSLKFRPPVTEDAVEICSTPLTRELLGLPCVRILAVLLQDRLHFQGVTLITFRQIAIFQGTNVMIHMRLEDSKQSISYRDLRSDRSHIQTIQVLQWSLVRSLTGLVVESPN